MIRVNSCERRDHRRNLLQRESVGFARAQPTLRATGPGSPNRILKFQGDALGVGPSPLSRHGIARSEGALVRASRADGGGSAIDTRDIDA
jgi:hypothetical protein